MPKRKDGALDAITRKAAKHLLSAIEALDHPVNEVDGLNAIIDLAQFGKNWIRRYHATGRRSPRYLDAVMASQHASYQIGLALLYVRPADKKKAWKSALSHARMAGRAIGL